MRYNIIAPLCAAVVALGACGGPGGEVPNPDLVPRGTQLTTVKPTRKDLATTVTLAGEVTTNPTYGLASPVDGQVRFAEEPKTGRQTRAATVWADGKAHDVDVPDGAVFSGRLVDDKAAVTAGMPVASAKHNGYAIVAELDASQAYQVSGALTDVRAQIVNGPGPFPCAVLGGVSALPAGTTAPAASTSPGQPDKHSTSAPTGLRVVCTAPADVTLINGAAAKLELVTGRSPNALVVPVEAVAGSRAAGKVDVLAADGSRRTTDVALGLTDGEVVEVVSGLRGDEELAVPGPDLADPTTGRRP